MPLNVAWLFKSQTNLLFYKRVSNAGERIYLGVIITIHNIIRTGVVYNIKQAVIIGFKLIMCSPSKN